MRWKIRHGVLVSRARVIRPYRIVLHHTAGSTVQGAVSTLVKRGLGYHYLIDKNGDVHEFVPPNRKTYHAYRNNTGTIGISYVGGGKYGKGVINSEQMASLFKVIESIVKHYPSVTEITGHKHIDPRGWKVDPQWPGEPNGGINWAVDYGFMRSFAEPFNLQNIRRKDVQGTVSHALKTLFVRDGEEIEDNCVN